MEYNNESRELMLLADVRGALRAREEMKARLSSPRASRSLRVRARAVRAEKAD